MRSNLMKRLVVEGDVVDVLDADAGLVQAVLDRPLREVRVVRLRVKRSSWAAATSSPSRSSAAAPSESW
jgi:hypothetical protein